MKVVKIIVADEQGVEQELNVIDGTLMMICEDDKVLTQFSQNAALNLEIVKKILS